MAREFPIHNGRMTTDLDANGHKIKNLPPGSGFTQVQSDWGQTDTTAPDFIKNKPSIPAPVTIDPSLSPTSENPVQNKAVAKALYTGFTEWQLTTNNLPQAYSFVGASFVGDRWIADIAHDDGVHSVVISGVDVGGTQDSTSITFTYVNTTNTMSRHLITPTKTSQLTNDGAPNGGGTPYATTAQIPTVPSAYTSTPAMDGVGSAGSSTAWAKGDHVHPSDTSKANATDLPYALVTPGKWEFINKPIDYEFVSMAFASGTWTVTFSQGGTQFTLEAAGSETDLSVEFYADEKFTATRASLPGHLLDRAGNRVVVTGDTTLTLPALVNAGKARDLLVRLEISGSTVPTITISPDGNESVTYETDGDEFPAPDEAGTWLYSFTETAAHKFAVSLKKVNVVTQGGV